MAALAGKRVQFEAVAKHFGAVAALDGIGLEIEAGEFCTLLGPSGSGKTTLLKVLAGFEPLTAGRILVDGRDIGRVPVAQRNIGMVFQNYALFPHMTVGQNIAFPLEMRKASRDEIGRRVGEALALVDLQGFEARLPRQLSGGQQQRTALARAIVFQPDILLMDEPLGALDKNLRQAIQVELKQLHRRLGVTIVYVTHDQEEAMHLSDRIVVLNEGAIEQVGTPEQLYFAPANRFVAGFIGECNFFQREDGGGLHGVRPEFLRVGGEAETCAVKRSATVQEVIFVGTGYKVILTEGETALVALTQDSPLDDGIAIGDSIPIGFRPERAFPLAG
ncbi:MAG: ABC transporter ATP-binding protein [Kiloniellales bacterium]|nr:ABC transporter ATP-binding protein [Kiloniellales bacterium]